MGALIQILEAAAPGGLSREHSARLRRLLADELQRGAGELEATRSGYQEPVIVALAPVDASLVAACPAAVQLRADPAATTERGWLVVAATLGAMVRALDLRPPARSEDLWLMAGSFDGWLTLHLPAPAAGAEEAAQLAALDLDHDLAGTDRLRARAFALPGHVLESVEDPRAPIGPTHPLRIAETVARLGGRPVEPASVAAHEEAVLSLLQPPSATARAHEDPDPVRRIARRILQRLAGMGKWGGYHTEFVHLARGFPPARRALAAEVGERLLASGLLVEKTSVGQRHVFLNPRRSGDIHRLIEEGTIPGDLRLPPDR